MKYSNELTVREARDLYFKKNGFDESGYSAKWAVFPVMGFRLYLPNLPGRRKAIPLHDIDHVLTEYETNWPGEWQISSYEAGTGCGYYFIAWVITLQAILGGGLRTPKNCLKAFARGRRSKTVYLSKPEDLLERNLGELRDQVTVPADSVTVRWDDVLLFYTIFCFSLAAHSLPVIGLIYFLVFH